MTTLAGASPRPGVGDAVLRLDIENLAVNLGQPVSKVKNDIKSLSIKASDRLGLKEDLCTTVGTPAVVEPDDDFP